MAIKTIKILAIDDNSDNLIVLKELIIEAFPGTVYISSDSGMKGLALCQTEKPDVILLDIVMPGMDGYKVCEKLKSDARLRHIPVIMITANRTDKESRVKALEAGADAFLPKPVDESELRAQIKAMLRIKESEDLKKEEKQRLEDIVLDRTEALEMELADRKKAENKLIQSLDKITRNKQAIMNLMEDLKTEMEVRKVMEENLQNERNLLRTLIDNLPDTIFILDQDGRKVIANREDLKNIGYSTEAEVLGKNDMELFPGEVGVRGHSDNLTVIKTLNPIIDREEYFFSGEGSIRWLLTSKFPLYDANGNVKGLFGTGHDITNRKKAEEDIKLKNRELQFLNKLATEVAGMFPEENMSVFLLKRLKEYTGSQFLVYSEYDSEQKVLYTRHVEADQKILKRLIKIAGDKILNNPAPIEMNKKNFLEMVTEVVSEKNSLNEVSFGAIPVLVDKAFTSITGINLYYGLSFVVAGELYGTALIGFNKTHPLPSKELLKSFSHIAAVSLQRRRIEEKLKKSEEQYRLLIENQGEGVGIVDLNEVFVFVNRAAEEMFGVEKGGLLNRNLLDFIPNEQKPIIRIESAKRENAQKSSYEIGIVHPNGDKRTIIITATPQFSKDKILTGTFGVFRDISDRKRAESELIKSKEKAEESDRLKTAFLHNISHEIRTPMNAIIGFSALLSEPDLDKESSKSYIDIITQSSNHLLSIVSDIIDISNIEAGILKLTMRKTNLNSILWKVYNQFVSRAKEKGIGLRIDAGLVDDESGLMTDETKLLQILSCILSNAVKFTPVGQIELGYILKGENIEFYVRDTGIGISEDQFTKIFERFYQVENSIARQYEGTGLGLSISKAFIELLGGRIWLDSQPGRGTTFYFTMPYVSEIQTSADEVKLTDQEFSKINGKKTILIAEDEENNFLLIEALLSQLNVHIMHARNGKEAVDIVESGIEISLVLMDIKMPVMDGYEATAILKKMRPAIPIVALTAFAFESDKEKAVKAGCDDYLSKPVKKDLLIEMIKKYI